jgi:hypothetical protein
MTSHPSSSASSTAKWFILLRPRLPLHMLQNFLRRSTTSGEARQQAACNSHQFLSSMFVSEAPTETHS